MIEALNGFAPWFQNTVATGVDVALKATLLLIVAILLDVVLGRRRALARSAVWNASLVGLLVLPLLTLVLPSFRVYCLPPEEFVVASQMPVRLAGAAESPVALASGEPLAAVSASTGEQPMTVEWGDQDLASPPGHLSGSVGLARQHGASGSGIAVGGRQRDSSWAVLVGLTYLIGVLVLGIRLAGSLAAVRRLRQSGTALTDPAWRGAMARWLERLGIKRAVGLACCERLSVPVAFGWLRPSILVPPWLVDSKSRRDVEAVLLHELAHVRRADYLWQLLGHLVRVVYWFHPLAWVGGRLAATVREQACDDLCAYYSSSPDQYGQTLLDVASAVSGRAMVMAGIPMARSAKIARRLRSIDLGYRAARCLAHWRVRAAIAMLAAAGVGVLGPAELARRSADAEVSQSHSDMTRGSVSPASQPTADSRAGESPERAATKESRGGTGATDLAEDAARGPSGVVRLPDGSPAANAEVLLCTPGPWTQFYNGVLHNREGKLIVETSGDGRFSFPPCAEPCWLVIGHEQGFVMISGKEAEQSPAVVLQPWGRVEGTLRTGDELATGQKVELKFQEKDRGTRSLVILFSYSTETDSKGRFAFGPVPPLAGTIGRQVIAKQYGGGFFSTAHCPQHNVIVESGQTLAVDLGGAGRPVIGRITALSGRDADVDWSWSFNSLKLKLTEPSYPAGVSSYQDERAWERQWRRTEEGRRHWLAQRAYGFKLKPDGTFRVEDVLPGRYELWVSVHEPPGPDEHAFGTCIGRIKRQIVVPEIPGGRSDEPLDLGTLEVRVANDRQADSAKLPKRQAASNMKQKKDDHSKGSSASQAGHTSRVAGIVVGQDGKGVVGVTVDARSWQGVLGETVTDHDGRFQLDIGTPTLRYVRLLAVADDGRRQGLYEFAWDNHQARASGVQIELKSSRVVTVVVTDRRDKPVAQAGVEVLAAYEPVASGSTDATGKAVLHVPADAKVRWIHALKAGAGFDYFENYTSWPPPRDVPEPPGEIRLVLNGARRVRVKAVDSSGRPVAGVSFCPWLIQKRGKIECANLCSSELALARTDNDGVTRFEWLPVDSSEIIEMLLRNEAYYCPQRPLAEAAGDVEVTAKLLRNVRIGGMVRLPDGKPAPNVFVQAAGYDSSHNYSPYRLRTLADGSYTAEVNPSLSYMIGVVHDEWAAQSLSGIIVRENGPRDGLDLQLAKGSVVHGRVTTGPAGEPAGDVAVALFEWGPELPKETQDGKRSFAARRTRLQRRTTTDSDGYYRFCVGPGEYELRCPTNKAHFELQLDEPREVRKDIHLSDRESVARGRLTGLVVSEGEPVKPIADALVQGASTDRPEQGGHADFNAVTDSKGRFEVDRWRDDMVIWARSADGTMAGCVLISADDRSTTIKLAPAAAVTGRIVDPDGKALAGKRIYGSMVYRSDDAIARLRLEGLTAEDGGFRIEGLVPGSTCSLQLRAGAAFDNNFPLEELDVSEAGTIDLGLRVLWAEVDEASKQGR